MNHLKSLYTGKAKKSIAGVGYTGEVYDTNWIALVAHFGRPQMVVNTQLRRIYTIPPVKAYESVALVSQMLEISFMLCTSSDAEELRWGFAVRMRPE